MSTKDFKAGDAVSYVPRHAHGDLGHPDVEHGYVTSTNPYYVFVNFGHSAPGCGKACRPEDLRLQHSPLQDSQT